MSMNGEQYEAILKALADKLNEKDRELALKDYEIKNLKEKLAEAEYRLNPSGKKPKTLEIR